MKTIITSICVLCLLGCSGLPPNATQQQRAQYAISTATKGIKLIISPAVTAYLIVSKNPARDAAMVYTVATAVNSAATGQNLSAEQLRQIIVSFGNDDPTVLKLAQLVASEYANVYGLFPISGTSPAKFLADIALSAENAAQPFLPQK